MLMEYKKWWWGHPDLNREGLLSRQILSLLCLPISPCPQKSNWLAVSLGFVLQRNCHAGKEIKTPIMLASCQKGELP